MKQASFVICNVNFSMTFSHNFLLVQINVWISAISFHAYADISFEETSDVSTGP